jgi:hypothetical protein
MNPHLHSRCGIYMKRSPLSAVSQPMSRNGFGSYIRGLTVKYANSPPFACGSSGQKAQYGLMTLAYQRFTAVLLLIYGNVSLSDVYYCLSMFCITTMHLLTRHCL